MAGSFYTGTSNIVLPTTRQNFPPEYREKSRLFFYSTIFNSLEVNSSFYKVPRAATFERWESEVKQPFRFTVKLWKGITHVKQLAFSRPDINKFLDAANGLGQTKGCLLVQFPASIQVENINQLQTLLADIQEYNTSDQWRVAVELRHVSWYTRLTYEILDEFHATLVIHDVPASRVTELHTGAPYVYLRFHGEKGDYRGSYSLEHLEQVAKRIQGWMSEGRDVYAYFNNTIGGAFENAKTLQSLVHTFNP